MSFGDFDSGVKSTSSWMAAIRAREHTQPDAYLHDPYAAALVPDLSILSTLDRLGGPNGSVIVRGRLGDAVIERAAAQGCRQAVTLGAGSDTRPWRLKLPAGFRFFEVDLPGQLLAKLLLLGEPACERVTVETDLRTSSLDALARKGFDAGSPCVWVAEGLLHYVPRESADALRDAITASSVAGSWFTGDVPHPAFAGDPAHAGFLGWMRERGSPFVGFSDDPADWLRRAGWQASAHEPADLMAGGCSLVPAPPARLFADHRRLWYWHAQR